MMDDAGAITGAWACAGRSSATRSTFSLTIWRATNGSKPQSNSTHTTPRPTVDAERTLRTPVAPFRAVSRG